MRNLPKEEEKPKQEITILSRRKYTTYPKLKQAVVNIDITYVAGDMPPRTITIPEAEYTLEVEKKRIKADIEDQLKVKPETYTI